MPVQLITAPTFEPVTLDEARQQVKFDLGTWDAKLTLLIAAARSWMEMTLRRALVTQTWEVVESHFPCYGYCGIGTSDCLYHRWERGRSQASIDLPKGAVASVTSVKYIDGAGVEQTMSPSLYSLDRISSPGRVVLNADASWPAVKQQWDAVRVRYVAGWAQVDVPPALKQAVLLLVSQMWVNDVPEVTGTIVSAVRTSFESLAAPYRVMRV